jgi:hypothetical protein
MNKFTKRITTTAVAVGLVATGSIGAYAAFGDSDVSDESAAETGVIQLSVGQGKGLDWQTGDAMSPASSTAEIGPNGYIGSSYVGEISRTTYSNWDGSGKTTLPPAFSVQYAIADEFAEQQLDDYVALRVRIRGNDCNLGRRGVGYFVDTFFVGSAVDEARLDGAGIDNYLEGFDQTFDRTDFDGMVAPLNKKICVETQLIVLDAENEAMGDDFKVTQTVVMTEADAAFYRNPDFVPSS